MRPRTELHAKLVGALGSPYVYFQPPENLQLYSGDKIVYSRDGLDTQHADDTKYIGLARYTVTLITKDPDLPLITELPFLFDYCSFDRPYTSNGSNHNVYTIFY